MKKRILPILLALTMIFTVMPMMMDEAYAQREQQIEKIVFEGDSEYEWSHFYNVDGKNETKSLEDLNITVLDETGDTIDSGEYDLVIEHTYYDETQDREVATPVEEPFSIQDGDKDQGFSEYRAIATAKQGSNASGETEANFIIMDKYCLNYVCPDISFENYSNMSGWRMRNRYWFTPGTDIAPTVKDCTGTELRVGTDYNVTYYYRSGKPEDLDNHNVGLENILVADDAHMVKDGEGNPAVPTEPGGYFVTIDGIGSYYGGNEVLIDIDSVATILINGERDLWSDGNLTFDVRIPNGIPDDIRFIVGVRGEGDWDVCFADRDNESDYYEYDATNKKLTLHGQAIFEEIGESYLNIYACAKDQGAVVAEGFADANVREAKCEYDLPEDDNILPGWDGWIDENIHVWRCNSEFPDGKDGELKITDVTIKSQNPDNKVLELNQEGDGWKYRANEIGSATIEVKYTDFDDTEKTHEFTVYVSDTVYNVDMWSETGIYQGLPGTSIELQANARKETAEKRDNGREGDERDEWWHHEGTSEGLQYQWTITGGTEFVTITPDSNDPAKAILRFNDLPAGQELIGEEVDVKVSVTDANSDNPEEVRCDREQDFYVSDEYFQIYPAMIESNLDIGKSLTIEPELRFYKLGKDGYDVVKNVTFEIKDYDGNAIDVDDLTITRKGDWDTNFRIEAKWREGGRDETRDQWYHLDRKNYEIRFEYDDFEIYDDQDLTVKLNKEDLEGLTEELADPNNKDYEIRYTVGRWDGDNETWESVINANKYTANIDGITISGKTIKDAGLDGFNIRAELVINGENLGDTWCWLSLRDSCEKEHNWIKATIKKATCVEKGQDVWICLAHPNWEGCGEVRFVDTEDPDAHSLTKIAAKDSTLTATGNIEHYKCKLCGKLFKDAAGKNEISAASTVVAKKIDINGATVAAIPNKTYNKTAQKPALTVEYGNTALKAGTDYTVSYSANVNVGTAKATITGVGKYAGTKAVTFKIVKAANPLKVSAKTATVKYSAVKKKAQTLAVSKVITISTKGQGAITYSKASGNKNITINVKTGKVTVKKGLKKGTYKVKVNVKAAGSPNYNAVTRAVTFTIKVK